MKYMLMDVEWSNGRQQEILQLAVLLMDAHYERIGQFYKRVCPKHIKGVKEHELRLQHLKREFLLEAPSISEVISSLMEMLDTKEEWILVLWNKEAMKVLKNELKQLGVRIPYKKVIILRDTMETLLLEEGSEEKLSILEVCNQYHIEVNKKRMHHAQYDVSILGELFIHFMVNLELYENNYGKKEKGYHAVDMPNKIHTCTCKIQKKHELTITHERLWQGIAEGYMPCKHCITVKIDTIRNKEGKLVFKDPHFILESYIHYLGKKYGYRINIIGEQVFLKGNFSKWYLEMRDGKVESVYHGNYGGYLTQQNQRKFLHQYHKQNIKITDLNEVMQYIHCHDHSLKFGSDYKKAHQRIDELFRMISVSHKLDEDEVD